MPKKVVVDTPREDVSNARLWGFKIKHLALVFLTFQTSAAFLFISYSRTMPGEGKYHPQCAVLMQELIKVIVSAAIVFRTEGHFHDLFDMPKELAKAAVPAGLFLFQNNLIYIGLTNLGTWRAPPNNVASTATTATATATAATTTAATATTTATRRPPYFDHWLTEQPTCSRKHINHVQARPSSSSPTRSRS
jgi:hypothetical protein